MIEISLQEVKAMRSVRNTKAKQIFFHLILRYNITLYYNMDFAAIFLALHVFKCVHMCRCVISSIPSMIELGCAIIEAMCSLMEPIDV